MMLTANSLQVAILSKYRTPSNDSVFQVQRSPLIIENRVNWSQPLEVINFKVLFPFKALQSPEFQLLSIPTSTMKLFPSRWSLCQWWAWWWWSSPWSSWSAPWAPWSFIRLDIIFFITLLLIETQVSPFDCIFPNRREPSTSLAWVPLTGETWLSSSVIIFLQSVIYLYMSLIT